MNELKVFEHEEFGTVRTVVIDGEPWLVGKDVAEILSYTNPLKAIRDHVDAEDKGVNEMFTPSGRQKLIIINESGFYSLVLTSKLPNAKKFKRWITVEVLPTIKKTGGYVYDADKFIDSYFSFVDEPIKQILKLQFQYIGQLNDKIKRDEPLVNFANQVSETVNLIDMNAMAKLARDEKISIGRNKLFRWLREKEILMSDNIPYQKFIDNGYFQVKESIFETGELKKTYQQTYVTGKGQQYIIRRLKAEY